MLNVLKKYGQFYGYYKYYYNNFKVKKISHHVQENDAFKLVDWFLKVLYNVDYAWYVCTNTLFIVTQIFNNCTFVLYLM